MMRRLLASRVEPVAVLSTMRSASSGGKTSVAPYGAHEGGSGAALGDPAPGEVFVLRGDHQRARGQLPVRHQVDRRRRHHPHRVETGVRQLDQRAVELGHPVRAGKAEVPRTGVQHLDDGLRFEDLDLAAREADVGPVAAHRLGEVDAGVTQQSGHAVIHAALGDGQSQGRFVGCSGHLSSVPTAPTFSKRKTPAGPALWCRSRFGLHHHLAPTGMWT